MSQFDIHLATDVLSSQFASRFEALGFVHDRFVGGTSGVVHNHHLSLRPASNTALRTVWESVAAILAGAKDGDFHGYAEAEVIPPQYVSPIPFRPFDPGVPLPFTRIEQEICPLGKRKTFDFHVTARINTLDERLDKALTENLGMYHVDVEKTVGRVRVFTFQPMDVKESMRPYYEALRGYLISAGGMDGKVKLETTFDYLRCPIDAAVPPVNTRMPTLFVSQELTGATT
jgi:hypothetical protein